MNVHQRTPNLSVIDPRSLVVRSVDYHRDSVEPTVDSRITRQTFDALGRLRESWDPRLWLAAPRPNLTTLYGLNGQPLLTDSVDAGWQLSLFNQTGSGCLFWDARGTRRQCEYDDQQRPVCVSEQMIGEPSCVVERFDYAGSSLDFTIHNQCGRLIRHDDPAGVQVFPDYGLAGAVLVEERRFLIELETPDWPEQPHERDTWLEDQRFITRHDFSAAGELRHQTDAMNNLRTFGYDVAGRLSETWLLLAGDGTQSQRLISDIRYNAHDQIESETAGNGVITRAEYSADDGRLIRLIAQLGDLKPLQDFHYRYDPVGNIVELEDQSQAVSHFNNQRIEPINRYRYDSLYQLVEAIGWEVSQPSHGPALPDLLPTLLDPTQRCNYTQRFEYDPAGNLITRHHSGAPGFSMFTSSCSNRSLAQREDGSLPGEAEIDSGFDACGNQQELQRGQAMTWDSRNQLSRVTMVTRANELDDEECYTYDRPGHRLRKVHVSQTSNQTLRTEVRYLPGLEIHRQPDGEEHHVISVEAGRCSVRVLHWPDGAHADQLRYSLCDHLGSSTVELDHEAGVLTQEHYYAFGGTACWAGKSALVAKYKTIRYSGKERDATGLYYYGYRYYAPWLQRWFSPDLARDVFAENIYAMVGNNSINFFDREGLTRENAITLWKHAYKVIVATGLETPNYDPDLKARYELSGEENKRRVEFVVNKMTHKYYGGKLITSLYTEKDLFTNTYDISAWVFKSNYKESGTTEYFASDVAKFQYVVVSSTNKYFGYLPSVVTRQSVTNQITLKKMRDVEGADIDTRLQVFLDSTPNGKTSNNIMNDFKLVPTGFKQTPEAITSHFKDGIEILDSADFSIFVKFSVLSAGRKVVDGAHSLRSKEKVIGSALS